ncbi:MAG: hypothetical protein Q4B79_08370 [Moraxella sp.]|uniref:hypothetical protein n=1 Tax=Moraxella sp. TaxID=479 RepID=UPI0026DAAD7B|nr:hypothetical protein [Moraxella sp.]MDO4450955.1 hypothetical protein [Moraxella sp.]
MTYKGVFYEKIITLALCALPCVAFADNAKPDLEPILIKQQTVSALPKELYEGWWLTYDVDDYESYALRFYLKNGEVHGEHHAFDCLGDTSEPEHRSMFKLVPTAKKGFDLRFDNSDFRSYMNFSAMLPKKFVMANQSYADKELAGYAPKGINWIYLYSETPTPYCPKS